MDMMRLDAFLSEYAYLTRKEAKEYVKKGRVCVNGDTVRSADMKFDVETATVTLDDREIEHEKLVYWLYNKPAGELSATRDKKAKTVVDNIPGAKERGMFPVGRLDKDTTGLLLITNDGELSHKLLSPKSHVEKEYLALVAKKPDKADIRAFETGIELDSYDDEAAYTTLPAKLVDTGETEELPDGTTGYYTRVTICEGKFHQIKKMFFARDNEVLMLKRIRMGTLSLPDDLEEGSYIRLTDADIEGLKK